MRSKRDHLTYAYLLRCWQEGQATLGEKLRWRFSVEEVLQKRPRQGFDSLEELVAFVQAELDVDDTGGGAGGAADRKKNQTERARETNNDKKLT